MKLFTKIVICLVCAGLCMGIFLLRDSEEERLEYDEQEFQALLEENELLYEQNLRTAYKIPTDTEVKEYLGRSYMDEIRKENKKYIAHRRAVQILAKQYCDIEPLDYDELLAAMEEENASRAEKIADGKIVYGVTEFDFSQFSTYYWGELENSILNKMMSTVKSGKSELEEYYRMLKEPLYTDGEKMSYYLYSSEGKLDLNNQQSYDKKQIELDFEEIGQYIRQYGVGEEVFLNFDTNQIYYLYSENEKNFYIQFQKMQKDSELSEDELSIIQKKIVREKYEKELETIVGTWDL